MNWSLFMGLKLALIVSMLGVLVACSTSDNLGDEVADCERFFVFDDPDWLFHKAVDFPAGEGPLVAIEPSLDWFAEYELLRALQGGVTESVSLRISGHAVSLDSHRVELVGAELAADRVGKMNALVGVTPDGDAAVVTMAVRPGYTVMLLSYGLDTSSLLEVAEDLQPVCKDEWVQP